MICHEFGSKIKCLQSTVSTKWIIGTFTG
jgi:hypothetical protein